MSSAEPVRRHGPHGDQPQPADRRRTPRACSTPSARRWSPRGSPRATPPGARAGPGRAVDVLPRRRVRAARRRDPRPRRRADADARRAGRAQRRRRLPRVSAATPALVDVEDVRPGVDALLASHVAQLRTVLAAVERGRRRRSPTPSSRCSPGGKRLRAAFCYWSWRAHGGVPGTPRGRRRAARRRGARALPGRGPVPRRRDGRLRHPARSARRAPRVRRGCTRGTASPGDARAVRRCRRRSCSATSRSSPASRSSRAPSPLQPVARAERARVGVRPHADRGHRRPVPRRARAGAAVGRGPGERRGRAREVIRAKAARYSVEHPIVLGAALADADEADARAAAGRSGCRSARRSSCATTCSGVFGDPATTGKPAGDDLREGKRTVLVARAPSRAPGAAATTPRVQLLRGPPRRPRPSPRTTSPSSPTRSRARARPTTSRRSSTTSPAGRSRSMDVAAVARAGARAADRPRARGGRPHA